MRITDLFDKTSIMLNGSASSKSDAIDKVVELMVKSGNIADEEAYKKQVYAREEESTTGVGDGIAIPHGRCDAVRQAGLAAMVLPDGVDYEALDDEPVNLIFLIAAPNTKDNIHVDVLSKLSMMLMNDDFVNQLKNASSVEQFLSIVDEADKAREAAEAEEAAKKAQAVANAIKEKADTEVKNSKIILAVTSCPTGIAHTYMAAEALDRAAKENNCILKVETRGSGGAKNVLTDEEIEKADCIIVAADANVPMERFDGKRLIECPVSDGIGKADELIKRAACLDAPIFKAENPATALNSEKASNGSAWHKIYTHLMNGVSHMLPFVVGGGILIAIAFLIDGFSVDMASLSPEMRANFGTITPIAAMFKSIGGTAFSFMLPVLAGFIAMSIGDRPGLALGFVGGLIAATGSSGFLGALAAGFLAGYVVVFLRKLFSRLPESLEKIAPVLLYPVFGIFIIAVIMMYVVEPPVGALNTALNSALTGMSGSSQILLGMILGGMMSVDMGGPFNKAAYVFGTASIAAGNYKIMAAVMIGGMVPPCAIALASLLFKSKFTKQERESGPTNFIMGLAFITEGAIPFAASDPIHVLPSCIIGAATAGALSMAFGCTLMAPHGGIFVFPVVGNALMYLISLLIGTVVAAVLLGILKKPVQE